MASFATPAIGRGRLQIRAAAAAVNLRLSMRPITTNVNVLVCGPSSSGKSRFLRGCRQLLTPGNFTSQPKAADASSADDIHTVLLEDSDKFASTLTLEAPEAGRALVYKFQASGASSHVMRGNI